MDTPYYYQTNIDTSSLKDWELKVVEILKEAVKVVAEVYNEQIGTNSACANFYPCDATREEIENAAKTNDQILSPYTVVKRSDNGFTTTGYYTEYKQYLDKIIEKLNEASIIFRDNGFLQYAEYLISLGEGLKSDNNDDSFIKYLKLTEDTNIDITLGAFETYKDKICGVKRAFQANLRIKTNSFESLSDYVKVVSAIQPKSTGEIEFKGDLPNLVVRIDNVIALGGWHAELIPVGSNYPNDLRIYKHGMKVLIYLNNLHKRYEKLFDLTKEIFAEESVQGIERDKYLENMARFITFHEVAEAVCKVRYSFYKGKLKELSDVVRELNADLTGIKGASIHVLSGILSPDDYRDIVIAAITDGLRLEKISRGKVGGVSVYADGWDFAIGYFIKEGGLTVTEDNKYQINFEELYANVSKLTTILNNLMANGDFEEAKKLFSDYSSKEILVKFDDRVSKYFK